MRRMPSYRVQLVRQLRQRQTESEQLLWQHLRRSQLNGLKFRRQRPLGRYVADFCCDSARLVIEIDGGIHSGQDQQEYDTIRNNMLAAYEYVTLRFTVEDIMTNIADVLQSIAQTASQRI